MKMLQIFKEHKWAIIFALIAVLITVSPQLYFRYDHKDVYQGIETIGGSEKMPRIREVMDGHPTLSSPYLKEGKDGPYLNNLLGANIIGYLGKFFSLNFNNTILLSRLLFPFLLFFVLYGFVFLISKDKLVALASSTMVFFGQMLISPRGILQILSGEGSTGFLPFFRPVVSSLIAFFFFSFLLFFWLFLEKKQYRYGIIAALILGLTFYDYFYTWTFLYAFIGVILLIFLLQKKWSDFKRVILIPLVGILFAIPYFWNLYQASLHPNYAEVSQRFGIVGSREPVFGLLIPSVFIIFLIFFPREQRERYFFLLALLITPFIVLNQQLITGRIMEIGHYHWHLHIPLAIIFLLIISFAWLSARKLYFFKKAIAILVISMSIYTGIFVQGTSYFARESEMVEQQKYGKVMDWLNENGGKEEVVFANDEVSHLVVIYTPLNVFYHSGNGIASLVVSNDRLFDALFSYYRLDQVSASRAQEVFFRDRAEISQRVYGIYYKELKGTHEGISNEVIQELVRKYQESFYLPDSGFFQKIFERYEVNYLIWDKKQNPKWQPDKYQFLEKKAEINEFVIYQKI